MPVHRDGNALRNTKIENACSLGTATTATPDNNTPLDRWLGQTMADETYNTLGFVQAVGNLDQWYTLFHADGPCSLDAPATSGAGQEQPQMDGDLHK